MSIVKFTKYVLCIFCMSMLFSCSEDHSVDKLEKIKAIGDENPHKALVMLDSLEIGIREKSDYVKNKYELLRIRLNDKADNIPNSDITIKRLVEYFESKGSMLDKQEAFYYAGSVYRDLQDTPRSLEYFLKSIEYAKNGERCDSMMLRNAYSNLNDLYYKVQNYSDAVKMAKKELDIAKKIKTDAIIPYLRVGTAYLALKQTKDACAAFDAALEEITHSKDLTRHQNELVYLLCDYSVMKQRSKADKCFSLIDIDPLNDFSAFPCMAFAQYYELIEKSDSVTIYCKRILEDGTDIYNMYDAAKLSFSIYHKTGNIKEASQYADIYMQLSDSLDFGKRQELAATVNNEFQYHLDQKREQELKDEKERYKNTLTIVIMASTLFVSGAYIFYIRRRNKHLKEVLAISAELQHVNAELSDYEDALKEKEQLLAEKIDQNKTFIKLLHQSELEGKSEDVIYAIRQSSTGKKDMKSADWKQLYQAVDELYPLFKDRLLKELGTFTEQQMQFCYLMRIGLSKLQIQNMTNLSRVTVWRWVKKYDWVLMPDEVVDA